MAARATTLKEFSTNGNSRTSTYTGHSSLAPKLVIEKRRVPENGQMMVEYSFKVVSTTTDAESNVISQKVTHESITRYPVNGKSADVSANLVIFRDLIASDEFGNSVLTQEFQ